MNPWVPAPERIYLQRESGDHEHDWTWCSDRIEPDDVEYIRSDRLDYYRKQAEVEKRVATYWYERAMELESGARVVLKDSQTEEVDDAGGVLGRTPGRTPGAVPEAAPADAGGGQ